MKGTLAGFLLFILCGLAFAGGKKDAAKSAIPENSALMPVNTAGQAVEEQDRPAVPSRNRGQGTRMAVLAPDSLNMTDADKYLAAFAQGRLNDTFSKYSAMTLIDRQNLDTVLDEQLRSESGSYSEDDYANIGNLTNAQYILAGTLTKISANDFSVQLGITNTETGERRTSFTKNCSAADLRQGKVINEAAAELLIGIGVELTETEKWDILNRQAGPTEAETALARGITAQKSGGNPFEALTYFYQAASFDSSMTEATGRLNTLTTNITGGNIGEAVQNDYQARMTWLELFKQCAAFYRDHPPFEILYEPDLTQGEIDFGKGTVDLSFRLALVPTDSGFRVLNDLLGRLEQTGNRTKWGFSGWPLMDVQPKEPAAVVFGGRRNFSFAVEAVIINADGETIASGSITLNSNAIIFYSGDRSITNPADTFAVFRFQNVNANDLTDNLTIGITKIDGIEAAAAGENGYVRIATGSKARMDRIDPVILAEQARQAELARQVEAARQAEQERQEKLAEQARVAAEQKRREELARIYPREIVQSMTAAELQRVEYESRGYSNVFKFRTRSEGGIEITGYTENINNIIIPSTISSNTVTAIGRSAYNKKNLTSVIIPNSVTSIGQTAFENNKLTSIIIPNSVKEIGYHAFLGNSITKISIPENVEMLKISFSTSEKVVDGLLTVAAIVAGGGLLAGLLSDSDEPAEPESFDNKFTEYYNRTGKRAGTYIYQNDAWVRQ